jgi:hypothetical protein
VPQALAIEYEPHYLGMNRTYTLGAHTRAAVSPDRFTVDPRTCTFLETAHDKGYDATITRAFPPFRSAPCTAQGARVCATASKAREHTREPLPFRTSLSPTHKPAPLWKERTKKATMG